MYKLNEPEAMSANVDGVMLIIQNVSFCYFSPSPDAQPLVEAILDGYDPEMVLAAAREKGYNLGKDREAFDDLVGQLVDEKIAVPAPEAAKAGMPELAPPVEGEEPVLVRYDDLREMLALDPIFVK